ncbi:MAG TPA: glycosyltransferase family A protein [Pyrinomonadaceae bacterium]
MVEETTRARAAEPLTNEGTLVSVVVPAYDCAAFIGETLDSVLAQTHTSLEVVVVNDGSPDTEELERVLAPYLARADGRVRYFRQENRGAGAARNRGVREARGEFVAFLDADDLWEPTYLEEQLPFMRAGGYDLAYTDALLFGDSPLAGKTYMETAPSEGEVNFISLVRADCNVITSGVVARRAAVLDAGLFDESLRNAQDFELWARLAHRGARLGYQRKVLIRYRVREGSLSGDARNRLAREWKVTRHIADAYELSAHERAEVERMLARQQAAIDLERGKSLIAEGNFKEARESIASARGVLGGWKLSAALLMLKVAPRLFSKLAGGRLRTKP